MIYKKFIAVALFVGFAGVTNFAFAMPDFSNATLSHGTDRTFVLPEPAGGSPVISLGPAIDPQSGEIVEGLAFIHYKKGYGHKPKHNPGGGGPGGGGTSSCFAFLAKDAKWKSVEPWVMNTSNSRSLDGTTVFNLLSGGIDEWEDATDGTVDGNQGVNILGAGSVTTAILAADLTSPDNVNEVYFADIDEPGVIAVTIVWGIFGGPPFARKLVEWDMVFDDVSFDWSAEAAGVAGKMDFDNIAIHELGHAVGMGHPESTCTEETMYAFADFAEIKKRDLNSGDIAGVAKLY